MTNHHFSPEVVTELRQAQKLIHKLDRLRNDQNRRRSMGHARRTKTTATDVRRRTLNTQIIRHLHNAKMAQQKEGTPWPAK